MPQLFVHDILPAMFFKYFTILVMMTLTEVLLAESSQLEVSSLALG